MNEKFYLTIALVLFLIAITPRVDEVVMRAIKCVTKGIRNRKGGGCGQAGRANCDSEKKKDGPQ